MESEKQVHFFKDIKTRIRLLLLMAAVLFIVAAVFYTRMTVSKKKEASIATISESALEKMLEISELSTVDYTYNAVAKVYDKDGKNIKYYVAYEGVVTAGIDFDEIDITFNEEEKKILIMLPDVKIHEVNVDMGTMEYIFAKNKYETETVSAEAYKASRQDLENRVKKETKLHEMAKENAIASVNALFAPWIEQMDKEYTIEVY
uniref:DUF4230 domain-containing protein n=1 Tax=Agathobacter sp. TaxID=2021311 RepID=UPI004055D893